MPEIAIVAGEVSGDASAAALVKEVLALRPGLRIWGAGGERMREAGVDIVTDLSSGGAIGIIQSLNLVPTLAGKYLKLRGMVRARRPDLLILVDFGAFNVRLGGTAKRAGIRTLYYFPPSSWRKSPRNARTIKACADKVITPFPWSEELLRAGGVDGAFLGHPLLDAVKPRLGRDEFCRRLGLQTSSRIIGLLPGSRGHEIKHNLLALVKAAGMIADNLAPVEFVVAAGSVGALRKIEGVINGRWPPIAVANGLTYDVMAHSELLLTCSGTATLEAAIIGTPMVIIYRGNSVMRLEYLLRRTGVLETFIGMPNIVADKEVCPELVVEKATPEAIFRASMGILDDPMRAGQMRRELAAVRSVLGELGATARAAAVVINVVNAVEHER